MILRNDESLAPATERCAPRDKRDVKYVSIRMTEFSASLRAYRATGKARMVGVFVSSGGQTARIRGDERDTVSTACRKFVRGGNLAQGNK